VTVRQPFPSAVQVATVPLPSHTLPALVHAGSLLQAHLPEPAFPVHT
jgi:hypothetical protein